MSSLLTNTSAMVALQTLRSINTNLEQTNNRVSTGLRVNTAADNAAYWSIATTIKSDNGALGAVTNSLSLGASTLSTTYTGLDAAKTSLNELKNQLTTATGENVDKTKIQQTINSVKAQLLSVASAALLLRPELAEHRHRHRRRPAEDHRLVAVAQFQQPAVDRHHRRQYRQRPPLRQQYRHPRQDHRAHGYAADSGVATTVEATAVAFGADRRGHVQRAPNERLGQGGHHQPGHDRRCRPERLHDPQQQRSGCRLQSGAERRRRHRDHGLHRRQRPCGLLLGGFLHHRRGNRIRHDATHHRFARPGGHRADHRYDQHQRDQRCRHRHHPAPPRRRSRTTCGSSTRPCRK